MQDVNLQTVRVLQNRVSVTKLVAPAPGPEHLLEVFKAAARAPDHGKLQPWRFLVVEGEGLEALSDVLVNALIKSNPAVSPSVVEKTRGMPFRAPMLIVAIAKCQANSKVPRQEQILACGAATQNILNALFALNFGAVWRTGDLAYNDDVKQALGLDEIDELIGFIYVGTPAQDMPAPPVTDAQRIFEAWPAK